MLRLIRTLNDWQSGAFTATLKGEIENLPPGSLPLEQGTSRGGHVDDSDITATVLNITDKVHVVQASVGIFFTEIVGGCSCGDDPMSENAYCELRLTIDKHTAEAKITLITDQETSHGSGPLPE